MAAFCSQPLPFPFKLQGMLEDMANIGSQNVVSWQPHGKAFRVHQPEVFTRTIMPSYFKQTQYKSFQRQLHLYGFRRIKRGRDMGGYYHRLFIRNNKSMSLRMTRERIKGSAGAGENHGHEEEAPNFYKEMVIMEDHHDQPSDSEHHRDFFDMAPQQVPIVVPDYSGRVTVKNTCRNCVCGRLDSFWLDMGEQKVTSSSLKKNDSFCNLQLFTGNVASVVAKEHMEDGDEDFFEGKKFHFVETSVPTPAVEDFLASVTARGPIAYVPKCA
jgi:hypothetical protein